MACRLIPQDDRFQSFHIEAGGAVIADAYWDRHTREWLVTADAALPALPAPFQRWTYEFAALSELCAFLGVSHPVADPARLAA